MDTQPTVLIVDDEPDIVTLVSDFLVAGGFKARSAINGNEALSALADGDIACVLLDVMMPGMNGFDVLRSIRTSSDVPVLFLSARQEDSDKIRGLGLGGDDYIVKSATPGEIVARVKAVLRRTGTSGSTSSIVEIDALRIDLRAREVTRHGVPVALTAREFDLLRMFVEHPRQVLTRDALYENLWGDYGDRHSLTVHIGRLREKLEEDPAHPRLIVTVWGVGYRFEGVVHRGHD
jgi:DNA-binding response OmpR family regulator